MRVVGVCLWLEIDVVLYFLGFNRLHLLVETREVIVGVGILLIVIDIRETAGEIDCCCRCIRLIIHEVEL